VLLQWCKIVLQIEVNDLGILKSGPRKMTTKHNLITNFCNNASLNDFFSQWSIEMF